MPVLGQLTQIDSARGRWRWTINGHDVDLTTRQIQSYRLLQDKCFQHAVRYDTSFMRGRSWPPLTKEQWRQKVNKALSTVRVIESDS